MAGIAVLNSFKSYKNVPLSNERFSLEETEKNYKKNLEKVKKLAEARHQVLHPVEEAKVVKKAGPLVVLNTPELERGHGFYKRCIVCHGKRGEGKKSQNSPRIGGQHDWYLFSQLESMKNGSRINKVMNPYLKKLSSQDFKDLASYISKLPKNWIK